MLIPGDPGRKTGKLRAISPPKAMEALAHIPLCPPRAVDGASILGSLRHAGVDEDDALFKAMTLVVAGLDEGAAARKQMKDEVRGLIDAFATAADKVSGGNSIPLTEPQMRRIAGAVAEACRRNVGTQTQVLRFRTLVGMVLGAAGLALAAGSGGWLAGSHQGRSDALTAFATTETRMQAAQVADYCSHHPEPQQGGGIACTARWWMVQPQPAKQ